MIKLLPCPFCGETPWIEIDFSNESDDSGYSITCLNKGCLMSLNGTQRSVGENCCVSTGGLQSKEKAVEAGNTRKNHAYLDGYNKGYKVAKAENYKYDSNDGLSSMYHYV